MLSNLGRAGPFMDWYRIGGSPIRAGLCNNGNRRQDTVKNLRRFLLGDLGPYCGSSDGNPAVELNVNCMSHYSSWEGWVSFHRQRDIFKYDIHARLVVRWAIGLTITTHARME